MRFICQYAVRVNVLLGPQVLLQLHNSVTLRTFGRTSVSFYRIETYECFLVFYKMCCNGIWNCSVHIVLNSTDYFHARVSVLCFVVVRRPSELFDISLARWWHRLRFYVSFTRNNVGRVFSSTELSVSDSYRTNGKCEWHILLSDVQNVFPWSISLNFALCTSVVLYVCVGVQPIVHTKEFVWLL